MGIIALIYELYKQSAVSSQQSGNWQSELLYIFWAIE